MRVLAAVGLASLATASAGKSPVSGVQKVIKLLGDLKTKVQSETAQGAKDAEAMENQCIESIAGLEKDVSYGGEKAEELSATAENENAKADGYAVDVATFAPQIVKLQDEMKVAGQVRADENKVFNSEEAELVESATMLTQAYSILKRALSGPVSLLQGSDDHMREVVQALSAIVEAARMQPQSQNKIRALLQADAEDSLSLKAPQAIVKNYESKSGVILDAIEDLQEKTAAELTKLREVEMDKKHAYELLVQDLSNQISTKEDMLSAAKQNEQNSRALAGQASAQLAGTTDALEADKTQLADTKVDCKRAAEEWVARKASAEQEVEVLQKAIDVLGGKFALLQTSVRGKKAGLLARHRNYEQREHAASILRQLGHKFNSFVLLQAAESAQDDPFTKVRGLIKDLIMQLEEQAAAEAAKEGKCKADLASGERDVKVKTEQMKKYQARLDSSSAKFEQLGTDVSELNAQIKQIGIDQQAWTKIRNQENVDNTATIKDAEESIEAINSAIGVLQEFYGTASLLQESSKQPQSDSATIIIEYLQTAQEDFEKIRQETETAEREAKTDYEKDMQAAKVGLTKKKALVEGKTQERAGLKVAIGQVTDDIANATKAWEAATEYLKNKKEECSNKAMSYEERKKRREDEIAGLQEALEILSSDE